MSFSFLKNLTIRKKILFLCTAGPVILGISIIITINTVVKSNTSEMEDFLRKDMENQIGVVAEGIYNMVETQDILLRDKLKGDLNVASNEVKEAGGVRISEESRKVPAVNQYTKKESKIDLPYMLVGDKQIEYNRNTDIKTPVVDKVKSMVGGTATIFQRMNEKGDMLRVATNVIKENGERAVGTYIPATNPDGKKNPVISKVLSGKTYIGRAYVVNAWYITAYKPIKDSSGRITGILYVGLPQESVGEIRKAIENIKVGETGYAFVLGGEGSNKYHSVIHPEQGSGKDFTDLKNSEGEFFVREMVDKALKTNNGSMKYVYYNWKNPGEKESRKKITAVTYYEPWGWVIAASTYESEFLTFLARVKSLFNEIISNSFVIIAVLVMLFGGISIYLSGKISRGIIFVTDSLKDIASGEGDLTKRINTKSGDETGDLAYWFNTFTEKIQNMIKEISEGSASLNSYSKNISELVENVAEASRNTLSKTSEV
ncbi:MAG: Cache 3/Cache 2 fusion domain-containing protein, partial [Thermodesulfobacteriota bacterium]